MFIANLIRFILVKNNDYILTNSPNKTSLPLLCFKGKGRYRFYFLSTKWGIIDA